MAIAYVSGGNLGEGQSGGSTKTVAAPSGIVAGNLLVMIFFGHNVTTISTRPSGWSNAITQDQGSDGTLIVEYKVAVAGDVGATSYTWELSAGAGGMSAMVQYSGVDETAPIHVSNSTSTSSGTSHTTPTITPTVDGCMILSVFGFDGPAGNTWSGGGDTERVDYAGNFTVSASLYESLQSTAASVSKTGTSTNSDTAAVAIIALEPAGGGGDPEMVRPLMVKRPFFPVQYLRI